MIVLYTERVSSADSASKRISRERERERERETHTHTDNFKKILRVPLAVNNNNYVVLYHVCIAQVPQAPQSAVHYPSKTNDK